VTERVAHAGGGLDGRTYTNSIEALTANQEKGFRYFELDFVFTSDGELVCLHDWHDNFEATFGFSIETELSLDEFEELVDAQPRFRNCTLESLRVWMEDNPDAIIVTDVKEQNVRALRMFLESLPDATKRVIHQVYYPYELNVAGDLGFEQIVWTLYLFKGNNDDVLRWIDEFDGAVAVTMRKERAKSGLSRSLQDRGIATYVHTINDVKEAEELVADWGVTEIYTDFLPPPAIPRFVE
jgi:glycerophosphoryl diester phosphodiesterase